MALYLGRQLTKEEYEKWKESFTKFLYDRAINNWVGCISTRVCEYCYIEVSDGVCLCIGYFICPQCGKQNGQKWNEYKFDRTKAKSNTFNLMNFARVYPVEDYII